jgi:ribosome-associated toxin RatA of RatAB toxin-antitoxin module
VDTSFWQFNSLPLHSPIRYGSYAEGIVMATGTSSIEITAPSSVVFDLIHDYSRRLEWDPFLRSAELLHGSRNAERGATSRCAAKFRAGGLSMDTEYVTFDRPKVAAVRLVRGPWCFKSFAATIRHSETSENNSVVTYNYNFSTKPRWLTFLLDPIVAKIFHRETTARLKALKNFIESATSLES